MDEGVDVTSQYLDPGRSSFRKSRHSMAGSPRRKLSSAAAVSGRNSPITNNKETSDTMTREEDK